MLAFAEQIWIILLLLYFSFDFILFISVYRIKFPTNKKNREFPLSIIIAVKNEAKNLKENLPLILNQSYSKFEIIVINDQSEDDTESILKSFAEQHKHLKYLNVNLKIKSSKKKALDLGIKSARYEHLIFTDADCKPLTNSWLKIMQTHFSELKPIVLGFSPYQKKSGFLNKLIRFETLQTAVNYFGFANLGLAYMGVGRNLAYTKSLYEKKRGFQSHQQLLSGDDDLFVNQAAQQNQIGLCINPNSFMESQPKTDFKSWVEQKRRHITSAPHYYLKHKLLLSFQYLIKVIFWGLALPLTIFLTYQSGFKIFYLAILLTLLSFKILLSQKIFNTFKCGDLRITAYFWEIILICIQFYIFIKNLFSPKKNW